MRNLYPLVLALLGLTISGCFSDSGDPGPDPETGSTGFEEVIGITPGDVPTGFYAAWDPSSGITPYPNDILGFLADPPTDGTLNLSTSAAFQLAASSSFGAPLNDIDGFSVYSRIQANFSEAVDEGSLNPLSVFLLEVALDPATRGVIGLSDETLCKLGLAPQAACPAEIFGTGNPFLIPGVDYALSLAPDIDAGGLTIQLDPLKALNTLTVQQFTPGALNGYLLILTDRITNTGGTAAAPDAAYDQIKQGYLAGLIQLPPPGTELPPLSPEEQLALYIAAHLAVVDALDEAGAPLTVENVVVTASFSPQDGTTVLETATSLDVLNDRPSQIAQARLPVDVQIPGGPLLPAGTPVTTGLLRTALGIPQEATKDNGDIYLGGINIPYFQETPTEESGGYNVLASKWVAEAGQNVLGDPDSTVISRWNPVPVQRADVTIPLIMSIPNGNSAWVQAAELQNLPVPLPTGWPVVVYQPGFTRNRADHVLVAEPWLDQGYAVITIDLPYHGITATDPAESLSALLRVPGTTERTFDLDLRNNEDFTDLTPDGIIDESSDNFLSPTPDGLLTWRDNLREALVTLNSLFRSVGIMDIDANAGSTDFDASQIHFVGHSGGAIVGAALPALTDDLVTVNLATPGAGLVKLISASDVEDGFGFIFAALKAGLLLQQGILPDSTTYNNYLRDMQNILNAGDPISYLAKGRSNPVPVFGTIVNTDITVVPAVSLPVFEGLGMPQIATPGITFASRGYTRMVDGIHGSFISLAPVPAATIEMQTEVALFLGGNPVAEIPPNGQAIVISNPDIAETD